MHKTTARDESDGEKLKFEKASVKRESRCAGRKCAILYVTASPSQTRFDRRGKTFFTPRKKNKSNRAISTTLSNGNLLNYVFTKFNKNVTNKRVISIEHMLF